MTQTPSRDGESAKQMALRDLGMALDRGDLALAKRIHQWLATSSRGSLSHAELRAAYRWPDERAAIYRSERGRRGGLAVLEKYGPEHFARITKGRKPRPRHTPPKETAGQPAGAVAAHDETNRRG